MSLKRASGAVAFAALVGCGGTVDPYRFDAPRSAAGVELAAYAVHEECVALEPGERVAFYFVSVAPVAFNIHYHDANAVVMPVARERATEESGEFTAERKQVYCLMWEAGAEPSVLEYRVSPLQRR